MAKIGPWSVKGVDNEARQLARKAAQASGLTIGSWIDRAILRATADPRTIVSPQDASPTPDRQDAESAKPEADAPEAPSGGVDLSEQDDAASIRERLEILAGPEEGPEERPDEEQPQADSFDEDKIDSAAADGARTPMAVPPHVEDAYRFPLFRYLIGGTIAVILLGAGIWAFVWLAQPGESYRTATKSGEQPKEAPAKSIPSDGTGAEGTGDRQQAKAKAGPAGSAGKQSANKSAARLDRLKKRAQRGEAMAQFDLGLLHIAGLDVSRDDKEAARWLEKSALQGFEKAQYNLGVLYDKGLGVKNRNNFLSGLKVRDEGARTC